MRARIGSDQQVLIWLVGRYFVKEGEVSCQSRIPVAGILLGLFWLNQLFQVE